MTARKTFAEIDPLDHKLVYINEIMRIIDEETEVREPISVTFAPEGFKTIEVEIQGAHRPLCFVRDSDGQVTFPEAHGEAEVRFDDPMGGDIDDFVEMNSARAAQMRSF